MPKAVALALLLCGALAPNVFSQYKDYPQPAGKIQPLAIHGLPSWMSLDMDLRTRSEAQTSINYLAGNAQVYELSRVRGGLEIRPTHWLTGYAQFHDVHALGLPLQFTAARMRDSFDLRQAYLNLHFKPVSIFAGRQELKFGDERLVGIQDWTNISRTFDGFDARIGDKNRVDLFTASVVAINPTSFDNHAGGLTFHGVYASIKTWVPRTTIEPYVFIRALPLVTSQQGIAGAKTETTPGMRVAGNVPGGFDYIAEGALQRGSYSNDSIHAGAGYVKAGYTAAHIPWAPRVQGEYDYATGNPHRNPLRIGTFDQLYPSNHDVFGLVDLFGWQNIKEMRARLNLTPSPHLMVLIEQDFLRAATTKDGIYNGAAVEFLKPPGAGFRTDDIGRGFDAAMKYVYRDCVMLQAGVGHFSPGELLRDNNHGAPLTLSYVGFTYRFKLNRAESARQQK
jgi:hypothetical protein